MTKEDAENPYEALARVFHEPNRLAIVSAVCAADHGLTFSEIKNECGLTDGNLNRHLKVLQEDRIVRIEKAFVEDKPRTTVFLTRTGMDSFSAYLEALEDVLKKAQQAMPAAGKTRVPGLTEGRAARA